MRLNIQGEQCLSRYDFAFLAEPFAADYPRHADRFKECKEELRKFFSLALSHDGPLAAMSHAVDALWHTFILHTPQYHSFCDDVYGEYLHHQPRSAAIPVPIAAISNFYTSYPDQFGHVPSIWFEDMPARCVKPVRAGRVPAEVQQLRWSGWPGRR